ncbi:L-aspartate oxidase [Tannockella kyphosi]|uniref:L-aspartate oxidase n=1 Tax=Tannockella kyphosi TaxID=2899121 RepID=UPI002012F71C|nr:L-aspartate oxidase [Tannockella kyphosi]
MSIINTNIIIVGCGVAGLFTALNLPKDKQIIIISKTKKEESDSFLAQGGICVLRDEDDYKSFFEDTLKAGHYENNEKTVEIMIKNSREMIEDLTSLGVDFEKENGELKYTCEGAHSNSRILFHKDITGKEITSKLLSAISSCDNISLYEDTTMLDIISENGECKGIICNQNQKTLSIKADYTVWATGGIGGLYQHSTNYKHLTGDALAIAFNHKIELMNLDYVQIHPTTFYSKKKGRRFLISESVRGEGGILYGKNKERFVDELLPRDIVSKAVYQQMKKDNTDFVWLSFENIDEFTIMNHFTHIYNQMKLEGYDIVKEPIPVVPAQHYYMGGVAVDTVSKTSMERLYAVGETCCNGVHGANRLASNSLLESLVFAKILAKDITKNYENSTEIVNKLDLIKYTIKEEVLNGYNKMLIDLILKNKDIKHNKENNNERYY